jgi:hypothetical protein
MELELVQPFKINKFKKKKTPDKGTREEKKERIQVQTKDHIRKHRTHTKGNPKRKNQES